MHARPEALTDEPLSSPIASRTRVIFSPAGSRTAFQPCNGLRCQRRPGQGWHCSAGRVALGLEAKIVDPRGY
jgi:hypothetical protein